jgi:hypothetical protein
MSELADNSANQSSEFFKNWIKSFSQIAQMAFTYSPETMPPELMREMRGALFQALAKSWEEFMRSPQFLEGTKQMMDKAIAFRKLSTDFFTQVRSETQGTTRADVDAVLLAVREMESRLTRRMDELAARLDKPEKSAVRAPAKRPRKKTPKPRAPAAARSGAAPK